MKESTTLFHRHATDIVGYWGEPTATMDWCEENHAVSFYIAEFWNSLTNFLFISAGIGEAIRMARYGRYRLMTAYLWLLLMGIGSMCFHASLKYEMQLLDEIPMLFLIFHFLYSLDFSGRWWVPWVAFGIPTLTSIAYFFVRNPVMHQVAFAVGIFATLFRFIQLGATGTLTPKPCTSRSGGHEGVDSTDALPLKPSRPLWRRLLRLLWTFKVTNRLAVGVTASVLMLVAFGMWNIDNVFCDQLHSFRETFWLRSLLQMHAWWHLGSLLAGMWTIAGIGLLRDGVKGRGHGAHIRVHLLLIPFYFPGIATPILSK